MTWNDVSVYERNGGFLFDIEIGSRGIRLFQPEDVLDSTAAIADATRLGLG